ncbi:thiol reductant ABC exporter subunit CydC [Lichenicoccus roseus]|uniref:Thiol reductant ABC exporter subunit CydC n=1 Tax=Lichenicoccus roseus TaxID=2683649 RepID=A0A5R9J6E8_9PROT|nr:thiol reductant ABC exporter subunit CydC [Lichenicoccus roseus]TLU72433.1 thiol reductant ABC exporter subunit CydC [Lichenicoccus roseus]
MKPLLPPLLAILRLWRPRFPALGAGILVSLVALASGLALLSLSGLRLAGSALGLLLASGLLLRGLGLGRVVLRYLERLMTHAATFQALADLRVWFFRRIAVSAAGGLGFRRTGDVLGRLVGDVEALDGLYLRLLVPLSGVLLTLPLLALVIGARSVSLALPVCLLFVAVALLLPWLAARASTRAGVPLAEAQSGLRVASLDLAAGLREIVAFGAGARIAEIVREREGRLLVAQHSLARNGAAAGAVSFLCGQAAVLLVLAAAIGFGLPRISGLAAVLSLFLLLACFESVSGLVRAGVLAGSMAQSARRVLEAGAATGPVAGPTPPVPQASMRPTPPADATLRLEDVGYRWSADRPPVFDGLSLAIPAGARVALLGPSGAGKSTLASLLLRVVAPQSGRITYGGVDVTGLDVAGLRRQIAWLSQSTHLFDDTIRANLLLAAPDADDAALWTALEQARIAEFVRSLPDQLDEWLGENGAGVSGGQGRRLALARTLLSPASVLILDEPCAGLDSDTERAFLSTLFEVAAGRTVILIAHRLTGVERLDRVWRLQQGRAVPAA